MPQFLRIALLVIAGLGILWIVGYLFIRAFRQAEDPTRLLVRWIITLLIAGVIVFFSVGLSGSSSAAVLPIVGVVAGIVLAVLWGRSFVETVFGPLLRAFDGGTEEIEAKPMYSIAEAKRKQGKFREAMYEIHGQLEKFPTDFAGQMMLAEIQAENLNDLPGGEATVQRICSQSDHSPNQIAYAWNQLADWHLKYDQDVDAARTALEQIVERFPETDLARTAANRLAHLGSSQMLMDARERPKLVLKPGVEYLGMMKDQSSLLPKVKDFKAETEDLVKHLEQFPQDTEARERLAVIYAEDYARLDLATEQIEQLINSPNESPRHIARWLNLLADLQVRCTNDTQLAKETLQRIVDRFAGQSYAELAQQRLMTLNLELKRYEKSRVVKLGSS